MHKTIFSSKKKLHPSFFASQRLEIFEIFEIDDSDITAFSLFFALLPRGTLVKRGFPLRYALYQGYSISEMLVFTELESSKVCDTFRTITHRVFKLCSSPLDMFYVILCLLIVYNGFL